MATLAKTQFPFPAQGGSFMEQLDADRKVLESLQAASAALRPGAVVGGLLKFPAADGYAIYLVTKDKPLTLQHVPFGDAWQVDYALIRGLRRADVEVRLERERRMAELFSRKRA